jgi:hypothetical protein
MQLDRGDPCDEWDAFAIVMHAITASRDWQLLQQRLATSGKAAIRALPARKCRDSRGRSPNVRHRRAA